MLFLFRCIFFSPVLPMFSELAIPQCGKTLEYLCYTNSTDVSYLLQLIMIIFLVLTFTFGLFILDRNQINEKRYMGPESELRWMTTSVWGQIKKSQLEP